MTPEVKKNIRKCKKILEELKSMERAVKGRPDIFLLVDELKTKIEWLMELYRQIIS